MIESEILHGITISIGLVADVIIIGTAFAWGILKMSKWAKGFSAAMRQGMRG